TGIGEVRADHSHKKCVGRLDGEPGVESDAVDDGLVGKSGRSDAWRRKTESRTRKTVFSKLQIFAGEAEVEPIRDRKGERQPHVGPLSIGTVGIEDTVVRADRAGEPRGYRIDGARAVRLPARFRPDLRERLQMVDAGETDVRRVAVKAADAVSERAHGAAHRRAAA